MSDDAKLTAEEDRLLSRAAVEGTVEVRLYRGGDFQEQDFLDFGVLERLVIRRRLAFLGRSGDQLNAVYRYGPTPPRQAA